MQDAALTSKIARRSRRFPNHPFNIQTVALAGLLLIAVLFAIRVAKPVLLPIALAGLASVLFDPIVSALEKIRVPRAIGALFVLGAFIGIIGTFVYRLSGPAAEWLESAPRRIAAVEKKLSFIRRPMATVSAAADRVEEITAMPGDRETVVVQSRSLSEMALSQTRGFLAGLIITLSLLYFMLAAGDNMLTRLAWLVRGGREPDGDLVLATQIRHNVSRYLLTSVAINIGLGIAVGTAMFFIGLPNPALWGVLATLLNFIPYVGGIAGVIMIGIAAISTIAEPGRALLAPAAYAVLNTIEGVLVTPAVLGRRMQLNPIAVFIFIMFSGWLWGIVGTLIAVPVLTSIKVVSDAHPRFAGLSAFLAR